MNKQESNLGLILILIAVTFGYCSYAGTDTASQRGDNIQLPGSGYKCRVINANEVCKNNTLYNRNTGKPMLNE